jgi:mannosyltransferase
MVPIGPASPAIVPSPTEAVGLHYSGRMSLPDRSPRWTLPAAIAISLLAAVLRMFPLSESLWLDELHTAWCAVGPQDELPARAAMGNQSPLYFWLQWLLITFLGASEFSLRLPSFLAGSLLSLASYLLARRWQLETAGLIAAGLIAVDPLSIFYATEARPYALVQLLALVHVALTLEVAEQPRPVWRAAWIAVAAILFHLHYTTALLIAAEAAFLFTLFLKQPPRLIVLLIDLAIVAILCLPALGNLQTIFSRRTNWAAFVTLQPIWAVFDWTPLPVWCWVSLLMFAGMGLYMRQRPLSYSNLIAVPRPVVLLIYCIAVPTFIAWLSTWTDIARLFFPRYLASILPMAALVAGCCVSAVEWRWPRIALGVLTIGIALGSTGTARRLINDGRPIAPRGEDWRGAIAWLNQQLPNNPYPVLIWSGLIESNALDQSHDELLRSYCTLPLTSFYPLDLEPSDIFPLPMRQPGQLDAVAESLIIHRGGAWLIVRGDQKVAVQIGNAISAALQRSAVPETSSRLEIGEQRSFGKVQAFTLNATTHP